MNIDHTRREALADSEHSWFEDGAVPRSREDRVAEAVAVIALVVSLGIGLLIALLPVGVRAATPAAAPSLELRAFKIAAAVPGRAEQRLDAAQAHAGDQLEYEAVYTNPTAAAVHHVLVTIPVPDNGVEYLLGSGSPDTASRDGKQFAALPLQRVETAADGRKVSRPAPAADYRFLRWDLGDVPAGATRTVRTRVHLVPTTVAAR